ncbi:MAG: tetratricopeptide repeat protein, partial [Myxococcota bacterium]
MDTPSGGGSRVPESEDAVESLLDQAEEALDDGDIDRALELCREVLAENPRHPGALFVAADAERSLGDLERAEVGYRSVTQLAADHSPAWSGLASVLFDQLRFDDARVAALRALRADPHNPEAAHVRGMLRERRADLQGADRDFLRAARLDPDGFPLPERLTDAMVTAIVAEATS